jgi:hypothetical protein
LKAAIPLQFAQPNERELTLPRRASAAAPLPVCP